MPPLIHFRPVRDQANKTFDLYLQRTRKYGSSLPDSILPPPKVGAANGAGPRMGTPQNESSWAGWAISSFTNKSATTSGDIQSKKTQSQTQNDAISSRASFSPLTADQAHPANSTPSVSMLHRQALPRGPVPPLGLTRTPTDQVFSNVQNEDNEVDDAWGDMAEEPFFDAPAELKPNTTLAGFDDGAKPDFEGWLKAQAQVKMKAPLPEGLAKPSIAENGRPSIAAGRSVTTGPLGAGSGTRKLANSNVKARDAASKTISTMPKETAAEDDWGDAWD